MRTNFRALNLENVEDRSLPSTYIMFATPASSHFVAAGQPAVRDVCHGDMGNPPITAEGVVVNLRSLNRSWCSTSRIGTGTKGSTAPSPFSRRQS